jgi:DNA-binding response OmpR family regulator
MMQPLRILIVDDDMTIQKFIKVNLEARGYQVLLAMDGDQAVKMIEREVPDLILLDIMMPKIDGFEVCRKVRKQSRVPIIILSAREGESDKIKCLNAGADDYITKPFSLKELLTKIKDKLA